MRRGKIRRKEKPSGGAPLTIETGSLFQIVTKENPCFLSGMSWATNNGKQEPVCMTFEEWKARPIRRSASATSAANGRYELHLIESHLNCVYFVETKHAANAEKAKEVVGRWQADWGL